MTELSTVINQQSVSRYRAALHIYCCAASGLGDRLLLQTSLLAGKNIQNWVGYWHLASCRRYQLAPKRPGVTLAPITSCSTGSYTIANMLVAL